MGLYHCTEAIEFKGTACAAEQGVNKCYNVDKEVSNLYPTIAG